MCPRLQTLCLAVALLTCALPSHSQDSRLSFKKIVSEQVDPSMPVNAVPGVGLSLVMPTESKRSKFDPVNIWILVPGDFAGDVDVGITTVDGRYLGKLLFAATPGPSRWEQVTLKTETPRRDQILRDYTRDHIAYTVSVKRAKGEPAVDWLLVATQRPEQSSGLSASVLLNSIGAETVFYKLKNAPRRMCRRIEDRLARHFDVACEVPLQDLLSLSGSSGALRIERVSGMERLDPVVVNFR